MGRKCFVIAPIGALHSDTRRRTDQLCNKVIIPALKKCGYEFNRSDKFKSSGVINLEIINHLVEDDLVIADLTDLNPNVFYELGIRHAVNRPVILIKSTDTKLPFDVLGIRAIDYDPGLADSLKDCKQDVIDYIRNIDGHPEELVYPFQIRQALKSLSKDEAQKELNTQILSELQNLRSDIRKVTITEPPKPIVTPSKAIDAKGSHVFAQQFDAEEEQAKEEYEYQKFFQRHGYYPDEEPPDEVEIPAHYELPEEAPPDEDEGQLSDEEEGPPADEDR